MIFCPASKENRMRGYSILGYADDPVWAAAKQHMNIPCSE